MSVSINTRPSTVSELTSVHDRSRRSRRLAAIAAIAGLGTIPALSSIISGGDLSPLPDGASSAALDADGSRVVGMRTPGTDRSDASARTDAADSTQSWWPGEVMVELANGVDAAALAEDHGAELVRVAHYAPLAVLRIGPGDALLDLQDALAHDDRVRGHAGHGRVQGAGKGGGKGAGKGGGKPKGGGSGGDSSGSGPTDLTGYQLQHQGLSVPSDASLDVSSVVVAVLDTGVAYEDDGVYAAAPSLASNPIVAPFDAVDGDTHANDAHQHGTHIASIIGSTGVVLGIAPGVALMPVRVLDQDNVGSEIDLIDGILHAVDHGADILNMSLAFGPGYIPSPALIDALQQARDAGVLPIAAGGNAAMTGLAFPAASPLVVAVTPTYLYKQSKKGLYWQPSPYRNASTSADLVLPGGLLGGDEDRNGVVDGILAETFTPGAPDDFGYWMMAGSSQAAAVASGAAAWLVAAGVSAECIAPAIAESGGTAYVNAIATGSQRTAGAPNLDSAITRGLTCTAQGGPTEDMYAVLAPFLTVEDDQVVPTVRVDLYSADGAPISVSSLTVHADLNTAAGAEMAWCYDQTGAGSCVLQGAPIARYAADGSEAPVAFTVQIGGVRIGNKLSRPALALYGSPALDAAVAALDADPNRDGYVLGFYNDAGTEPGVGDVVEGYAVFNSGTGISTSPFGFYATLSAWSSIASMGEQSLELGVEVDDPTGTTTTLDVRDVSFEGSGISTSPFGFLPSWTGLTADFSGSGISTSPFGLWSPKFGGGTIMGASTVGPAVAQRLSDGGWVSDIGPAGTALTASGAFGDLTCATGDTAGSGAEAFSE